MNRSNTRASKVPRATRRAQRGQSIAEFALVLPLLLALLGTCLDLARVYSGWITLQSATRNAAEQAAMQGVDGTHAATIAQNVVCAETAGVSGYQGSGGSCTAPTVSVSWSQSTNGGTTIASARVATTLPFQTLFAYPFLSNGSWNLAASSTYEVIK